VEPLKTTPGGSVSLTGPTLLRPGQSWRADLQPVALRHIKVGRRGRQRLAELGRAVLNSGGRGGWLQ
jgi:hypothetical protein